MNSQDVWDAAKAKPLEIIKVEQPRLGQTWGVREMDAREYARFTDELDDRVKADEGEAWFVVWTVCDPETGVRMFSPPDVPKLMTLPGDVLRRVWIAGSDLNGLGKRADEAKEKNSEAPSAVTS